MFVTQVRLKYFRNYQSCLVDFGPGKNILLGANAQGKSNLLEAIEIASCGKSTRASEEHELIGWGQTSTNLEITFQYQASTQSIALELCRPQQTSNSPRIQKTIKVNGVIQSSRRGLFGHLPVVSFKTSDLNLLRGGPKFRREWLDNISLRLKPSFHDILSNYAKSVTQRNKLLKALAEKGKITVSDHDELLVWDKQLARFGSIIIQTRLRQLEELLPLAENYQRHLSSLQEQLSINYTFAALEKLSAHEDDDEASAVQSFIPVKEITAMDEAQLAQTLLKLMKERRWEELKRKQSVVGPHRDDVAFALNGASATSFASQGQQRSIVLSLKLAELKLTHQEIKDTPILLLDDVLAELDTTRQALLMSAVTDQMQTIITTTHLNHFADTWLADAKIMTVDKGNIIFNVQPAKLCESNPSCITADIYHHPEAH